MIPVIARVNAVVLRAVTSAGCDEAFKWAGDMQRADRVGFFGVKELAELRGGT